MAALRQLIQVETDPGLAPDQAQVTVKLTSGREVAVFIEHAAGSPEYPLTAGQLAAKFAGLATLTGMGLAFVHERRWVGFEAPSGTGQRLACFVLGIVVVLGIRFGLKAALTGLEPEVAFRFARYILIGLWAGVGAPWTFVRLGWAPAPGRQ